MPNPRFFSRPLVGDALPTDELQAHQSTKPRLLCLKGEEGTLACRVHDPISTNLIPKRSPWGRLKYSMLSDEKMRNLTAVRGAPGAGMVGPADYFCDLERTDQYAISLEISPEGTPTFTQHPLPIQFYRPTLQPLTDVHSTKVKAQWFSGLNKTVIQQKKQEYQNQRNPLFSESLFPNSGILEIEGNKEILLKPFDPKGVDLSAFKARLVPNDLPFQITPQRLRVDDEYCAVSYQFDDDYADTQVKHGGGVFLEFHQFAQTITPLHQDSDGFVTLAKWDETHTQLELIAVQIPYGYTLIIDKDCIHGDSNLNGLFMMCMTADHISMATADTVFLKQAEHKTNIAIEIDHQPMRPEAMPNRHRDAQPLVFYKTNKTESFSNFKKRSQSMEVIFNPWSLAFWEVKQEIIGTAVLFVIAGASLAAAILLVESMLILSLILTAASVLLTGAGFFQLLSSVPFEEDNNLPLHNALAI